MNKEQRKQLEKVTNLLEEAKGIVETIKDEEQGKFDNLNEGLQASEKGQKLEENVSTLEDVVNDLESCLDNISTASE